jgi:hypothetical protein
MTLDMLLAARKTIMNTKLCGAETVWQPETYSALRAATASLL